MKNVYVSVDIEGIWGVGSSISTKKDTLEYRYARENMITETNILIEELLKNGVENITVNDGHGSMDNLIASQLNPNVNLVSCNGSYKPLGMMEGINSSYDACCFIGYHAREGTQDAFLNHTISSKCIYQIEVNGVPVGETMLNAYLASCYHVPLLLVAGDDKYISQTKEELGDNIPAIQTKKSINRETVIHIPFNQLKKEYVQKVQQGVDMKGCIMPTSDSYEIKMTFRAEDMANFVARIPTVERIDSKSVVIKGKDYVQLYQLMRFCIKVVSFLK